MRLTVTVVLLEAALFLYVLFYVNATQSESKMEQENHPPETVEVPYLPLERLENTVSLFAGPEFGGIDLDTPMRQYLSFQPGQMIWLLLSDSSEPHGKAPAGNAQELSKLYKKLQSYTEDGLLNILYDVGSVPGASLQSWSGCAVGELQASPLLPWAKHLDFVVLSSLEDEAAKGLPFITNLNEEMLIVVPPCDLARLKSLGSYMKTPNTLVVPEGIHQVGPELWLGTWRVAGRVHSPYELNIIVGRRDRSLALLSGSGFTDVEVAVGQVQETLGRPVSLYVGETNWQVGYDTYAFETKVAGLKEKFPSLVIIPNGNTSMVAHSVLETMLGSHYRPGRLGTRVSL